MFFCHYLRFTTKLMEKCAKYANIERSFYGCYKSAFSEEVLRFYTFYFVVFTDFEMSIDKAPSRLDYKSFSLVLHDFEELR
jgi:hypothetical protein